MSESNVWIDLTDFAKWKGHFSGIQRVIYCYAERYYREGAHFFVYNSSTRKFVEIDGTNFFNKAVGIDGHVSRSMRERTRKVYRLLPRQVRTVSTPMGRKVLHEVYKGKASLAQMKHTTGPFKEDDVVLVLGAGWESERMIHDLSILKSEKHFNVIHLWHDLLPLSESQLFDSKLVARQRGYTAQALRVSDANICISNATLKDLEWFAAQEAIQLPSHMIIREGEDTYHEVTLRRPDRLPEGVQNFVLSLGTLEVRKNHIILYQAYKLAEQEGVEMPPLVIVGRKGWLAHDFFTVLRHDEKVAKHITVIEGVPDDELSWLFENCLFSIYPSLCEGWGLTISDSLGKGKLCLTSNVSSMPEVAGDLADYFSPYDPRGVMDKIHHYATNDKARQEKEEALRSYTAYTWDESFTTLLDFVQSLKK